MKRGSRTGGAAAQRRRLGAVLAVTQNGGVKGNQVRLASTKLTIRNSEQSKRRSLLRTTSNSLLNVGSPLSAISRKRSRITRGRRGGCGLTRGCQPSPGADREAVVVRRQTASLHRGADREAVVVRRREAAGLHASAHRRRLWFVDERPPAFTVRTARRLWLTREAASLHRRTDRQAIVVRSTRAAGLHASAHRGACGWWREATGFHVERTVRAVLVMVFMAVLLVCVFERRDLPKHGPCQPRRSDYGHLRSWTRHRHD